MTTRDKKQAIGNALWELRRERSLTQKQAAARIGVCHQALSHWERARCQPSAVQLWTLLEMYGSTLRDFERVANTYLGVTR